MKSPDDTICAIATPKGEGGIGIVRLSGSQAVRIASENIRLRPPQTLEHLPSYRLKLAKFCGRISHQKSQAEPFTTVLDEVLVVVMRAPRSYTGEDVVEIHCHGGPLVVGTVCESLLGSGARLADPGEFTRRAFLNGKFDLTQAEAVLDTIHSNSLQSLKLAQEHLQGKLSEILQSMKVSLVGMIAHLEAGMDFADEDIRFIDLDDLRKGIQSLIARVTKLIESSRDGRIIREGVRTVLMGRPNVGKSSLLNALLGVDRAIVSRIPGTTRDVLEESAMVDGILVRFFDTAGLRETPDELETEGMNRALRVIDQADVAVLVFDRSELPNKKDLINIVNNYKNQHVIVLNKSDLQPKFTREMAEKLVTDLSKKNGCFNGNIGIIEVSALRGDGIAELKQVIKNLAVGNNLESQETVPVSKMRHVVLLKKTREALEQAENILKDDISQECLAMELRTALHSLGEIIGEVTNEDILDQIFKDFCIGK